MHTDVIEKLDLMVRCIRLALTLDVRHNGGMNARGFQRRCSFASAELDWRQPSG
jgi:hypothetical protein